MLCFSNETCICLTEVLKKWCFVINACPTAEPTSIPMQATSSAANKHKMTSCQIASETRAFAFYTTRGMLLFLPLSALLLTSQYRIFVSSVDKCSQNACRVMKHRMEGRYLEYPNILGFIVNKMKGCYFSL